MNKKIYFIFAKNKKLMFMKNLLLAISLFTVLASCSSSKEDFIDNPTDKEISFELNGEKKH